MLFFVDESWQVTKNQKYRVGILAAINIKSYDYNDCAKQMYFLKKRSLGFDAGNVEIKGKNIFRNFLFKLESKGVMSNELNLARDIFRYIKTLGNTCFASVVFAKNEIDLACANENQLERPFFFLFERINLFMKENYPEFKAKLVFDDRGIQINRSISKSVSNFFQKSSVGKTLDSIVTTPLFAISTESVGIQLADMVAYILGSRFTGTTQKIEFFKKAKEIEFKSRAAFDIGGGQQRSLFGFKVIKEKEAGDLFSSRRTE
jgi:hypothetical protein